MPEHNTEDSYYSIGFDDFFKSAFSVDAVVFGFDEEQLKVLLIRRGAEPYMGDYALPGDLVYPDEDLDLAARRVLMELTGLRDVFLEQVKTFGKVNRHPMGRVITIAYYSLVKTRDFEVGPSNWAKEADWFPVEALPQLAFDHQEILNSSLKRLREEVRNKPIGFELLPDKFTLAQLQSLYESLLGVKLDVRNFRKKILAQKILQELTERQHGVAHRPAKLYRFNRENYETLRASGEGFKI